MENIIVIAIILVILVSAISYIIVQKKRGAKCIGCSACPSKKKSSGCDCNH